MFEDMCNTEEMFIMRELCYLYNAEIILQCSDISMQK
jgi:hypothetical protein